MKTKFTLKNIEVEAIKIGEITIEQDYSVSELISAVNGGKSFVKGLLKELPEMISDAQKVIETIDIAEEKERQEQAKAEQAKAKEQTSGAPGGNANLPDEPSWEMSLEEACAKFGATYGGSGLDTSGFDHGDGGHGTIFE